LGQRIGGFLLPLILAYEIASEADCKHAGQQAHR
jgi:hypothetical protein